MPPMYQLSLRLMDNMHTYRTLLWLWGRLHSTCSCELVANIPYTPLILREALLLLKSPETHKGMALLL
jgi:hypothetical protein